MATGNTGCARCQRGFTLLELMVVLVIIGLSVSLAALSVPDGAATRARSLGQQLTLASRLAQSQALAEGRIIALELQPDGYRFLRYQAGSEQPWQPFEQPALLHGERFAADWQWRLTQHESGPVSRPPRLYFWPDGTLSPFALQLRERQPPSSTLWTLTGGLLNLDWQPGAASTGTAG